LNPIAILDVQHVKLFELVQQFLGRRGVVTVTFQLGHNLALPSDVPLSLVDMALACARWSNIVLLSMPIGNA
jgi:hypothetical protein